MTEKVNSAAANAQGAAKKVNRRGINNSRHAVNRLKFHEKDAAGNALFIGHFRIINPHFVFGGGGYILFLYFPF